MSVASLVGWLRRLMFCEMSWFGDRRAASHSGRVGSTSRAARVSDWLKHEFSECYVSWSEACDDVQIAYDHWLVAQDADREGAFLAYQAALDREECAARDYSEMANRVRRGPAADAPGIRGTRDPEPRQHSEF
jgi:hypothetical protein